MRVECRLGVGEYKISQDSWFSNSTLVGKAIARSKHNKNEQQAGASEYYTATSGELSPT